MQAIIDFLSGKKTYLLGTAALVFSLLVLNGVITPEQESAANKALATMTERFIALLLDVYGFGTIFQRLGSAKAEAAALVAATAATEATRGVAAIERAATK